MRDLVPNQSKLKKFPGKLSSQNCTILPVQYLYLNCMTILRLTCFWSNFCFLHFQKTCYSHRVNPKKYFVLDGLLKLFLYKHEFCFLEYFGRSVSGEGHIKVGNLSHVKNIHISLSCIVTQHYHRNKVSLKKYILRHYTVVRKT